MYSRHLAQLLEDKRHLFHRGFLRQGASLRVACALKFAGLGHSLGTLNTVINDADLAVHILASSVAAWPLACDAFGSERRRQEPAEPDLVSRNFFKALSHGT